ncbi:S8 family serine peptidase [Sphingomonas sp. 2R-10]|uniref:S8 family serine peptidase n=1 Tax=Sphingomonas sp. 2R-10 TaxID=3045148 RepID=UPI000F767AD2|nr:S8 family serine peptidase [Sphingomonas sp. 2R-10]MDJ0278299.1 S8 family serine peptidase [Sphingomonas sp. 2R-10]
MKAMFLAGASWIAVGLIAGGPAAAQTITGTATSVAAGPAASADAETTAPGDRARLLPLPAFDAARRVAVPALSLQDRRIDLIGIRSGGIARDALVATPLADPDGYLPPVGGEDSLPPANYADRGRIGDPDSWVSSEFRYNYGLGRINAQHAYARGLTGRGVKLGIVDDGVDLTHSEFAGKTNVVLTMADTLPDGSRCQVQTGNTRIMAGACYAERGDRAEVSYFEGLFGGRGLVFRTGHGNHVGGIMVGNRDNNGNQGVAYGANLVTARNFGDTVGTYGSLLAGLFGRAICSNFPCDAATTRPDNSAYANMIADMNASGARIVNNSWGFPVTYRTRAAFDAFVAPIKVELEELVGLWKPAAKAGVINVFSAGNDGGAWANPMAAAPVFVPELEDHWVAVVNTDANDRIDQSSSICGPLAMRWCVAAPGTDIQSAATSAEVINGDFVDILRDANGKITGYRETSDFPRLNGYASKTGTSMAAPHVTGALALLVERYPYLQSAFVRDILLTTATDLGAPGVDEVYGWGLVDLRKAIDGPGQLIKDSRVDMTSRAGGTRTWTDDAWDDWKNDISGTGRLTKAGAGWLRLSGANSFGGATVEAGILQLAGTNTLGGAINVTGGEMRLTGTSANAPVNVSGGTFLLAGSTTNTAVRVTGGTFRLAGTSTGGALTVDGGSMIVTGRVASGLTTVGAGGRLSGTGQLANTVVNGTIIPGLAPTDYGRLTVNGTYVQNAGSTFLTALAPVDRVGLVAVNGVATLNGGTVDVAVAPERYTLGQRYTLLTATGGLTGRFDRLSVSGFDLPFLAFGLNYTSNVAAIDVRRGITFTSVAGSQNRRAVAGAIDRLADSSTFLNAASQLEVAQAQTLFDEASGETHTAVHGALLDTTRLVRQATIGRVVTPPVDGTRFALWGDYRQFDGSRSTDGNAGSFRQNAHAYVLGGDLSIGGMARIGGLIGTGHTDVSASRGGSGRTGDMHYGGYASVKLAALSLSGGGIFSDHDSDVRRSVTTPGFVQQLSASYKVKTRQFFGDAAFDMPLDANATGQAFVQYANVRTTSPTFTETGGTSLALTGAVDDNTLQLGTAGIRVAIGTAMGVPANGVFATGTLAYRRAWGDRASTATFRWTGGSNFTIQGLAAARDAFAPELGVGYAFGNRLSLQAGYSGEFAKTVDNHIVSARAVLSF